MSDYATARANMVENQLRPNRIEDERLLGAMGDLPRERFVPAGLRGVAYADQDIPLGAGRFLIEPLGLGKLLQAAAVGPEDSVLVIGDATGYAAAVLARLARAVLLVLPPDVSVETVRGRLGEVGAGAVEVEAHGDPAAGVSRSGFGVIVIVGAVRAVPEALRDKLADAGRLVAVVGSGHGGKVTVVQRLGGSFASVTPFDAALPPVPGLERPAGFVF